MKCLHCGKSLTLNDVYCPACGCYNEQAKNHTSQMESYKKTFESTRDAVIKNGRRYNAFSLKVAVIVVLVVTLVGLIGSLFVAANGLDMTFRKQREKAHIDEIHAQLEEYVQNRDYDRLAAYVESNMIYTYDDPYYRVICTTTNYKYFDMAVQTFVTGDRYMTDIQRIESVGAYLSSLRRDFSFSDEPQRPELYTQGRKEYLLDLQKHVEYMLVAYFNISYEEAHGIWELEDSERTDVLIKGYKGDEQ